MSDGSERRYENTLDKVEEDFPLGEKIRDYDRPIDRYFELKTKYSFEVNEKQALLVSKCLLRRQSWKRHLDNGTRACCWQWEDWKAIDVEQTAYFPEGHWAFMEWHDA